MYDRVVHDIMVPLDQYPCVRDTHTLREAMEEMGKVRILKRVALVFDEKYHDLLGLLRRRDIMRGLEPRFMVSGSLDYRRKLFEVEVDSNLAELSHDKIIGRLRERANRPVKQFMIPIKATINHNEHIMKAMNAMVAQNTSLLPVLKDGNIVGVVRSVDVLNEIARMIGP